MKKYKCVLFDLDGTLADTFLGILHSYQYAAEKIRIPIPSERIVGEVIGAPLKEVFTEHFCISDDNVTKALEYYRHYYKSHGLYEVKQYEKINSVLIELKKRGYFLGVTTLKNEKFAKDILNYLGISDFFDVIVGMDNNDQITKSQMIKKALILLNQKEEQTVLVGDSSYDAMGAMEAKIDFIGVTYGFGFKTERDVKRYKHVYIIQSPMDLLQFTL